MSVVVEGGVDGPPVVERRRRGDGVLEVDDARDGVVLDGDVFGSRPAVTAHRFAGVSERLGVRAEVLDDLVDGVAVPVLGDRSSVPGRVRERCVRPRLVAGGANAVVVVRFERAVAVDERRGVVVERRERPTGRTRPRRPGGRRGVGRGALGCHAAT